MAFSKEGTHWYNTMLHELLYNNNNNIFKSKKGQLHERNIYDTNISMRDESILEGMKNIAH